MIIAFMRHIDERKTKVLKSIIAVRLAKISNHFDIKTFKRRGAKSPMLNIDAL